MQIMKTNDNDLINYFGKSRNIKKSTINQYKLLLKEYSNYTNMSLHDLLIEAENEEEKGIRWKHRTLKKRLIDYRSYLYEKHAKRTAKDRFNKVKAFYKHFDIEIHHLPPFNQKNLAPTLTYDELLTKEIIRDAIDVTSSNVMKPLILFIASSGCARAETLSITVGQYIQATKEYHHGGSIKEIIETLSNIDDIVPTFEILRIKTNKYYTAFCSPEACNAINIYLQGRQDTLHLDSKLFRVDPNYLVELFTTLNDDLELGKAGTYGRFRTHQLRKFHASALMNDGLSSDIVNDLQGRTKPITDESYFFNNKESLKEEYINHLPAVTVMQDVEKITVKSPEVREIESRNKELLYENSSLKNEVSDISQRQDKLEKLILGNISDERISKIDKLL